MSGSASAGWKVLFFAGVLLVAGAVLMAIQAVPYLMLGFSADEQIGTSATGRSKLELALVVAGVGLLCLELYRKRASPRDTLIGQRPRFPRPAFRRVLWTLFVLEVGGFAWIVFHQMCPAEMAVEAAFGAQRAVRSGPQGMTWCWVRFLSYSAAAAIMTGLVDVLAYSRARAGA